MRRGVALLLVLVLLAVGSSMALSFIAAQSTTLAISQNLQRKAQARANAELLLFAVSRYLEAQTDWRTALTEGDLITSHNGVSLTLADGLDTDDDGTVESDGDLNDDLADPVTLTATAFFDGVEHTVSRAFWPAVGGGGPAILMIVGDDSSLTAQESLRHNFLYNHGYNVLLLNASASTTDYNNAISEAEAVYVPATAHTPSVGNRLDDCLIGIVSEASGYTDNLGLASSDSVTSSGTTITITDASHPILGGYSTGPLQITGSSASLVRHASTSGSDAASLASLGAQTALLALETAGIRADSSVSPARRVALPWGAASFDFAELNADGRTILTQSIDWVASGASRIGNARLLAFYNFIQGDPIPPQLLAHWSMDDTPPATTEVGFGVLARDSIKLWNGSSVDSYQSTLGSYGGSNIGAQANLATNTTENNKVEVSGGTINGNLSIGLGGTINNVVKLYNGAAVTGTTEILLSNNEVAPPADHAGMPGHTGNRTDNGGNVSLGTDGHATDYHFNQWVINNGTQVTIHGDVRIQLNNKLDLNDGDIILAPDATLHLAARHNITVNNGSSINADSARTGAFVLDITTSNRSLTLNGGVVAGTLRVGGDITLNNNAAVYGKLSTNDDLIVNNGSIHIDLDRVSDIVTYPPFDVADERASRDGRTSGVVLAEQPGFDTDSTSLALDGSTGVVEVPHDNAFMIDRGAISLWFRAENLSGKQGLLTKDSKDRDNGGHLSIYTDGSRVKATIESRNSTYNLQSGNNLSPSTWHHVTFVFGSGGAQLYLDGNLVDTDLHNGGIGSSSGGTGNEEPWLIGAMQELTGNRTTSGWNHPFEGRIDDIRVYRTRLSPTQIADILSGNEPAAEADPTLVEDRSGYGIPAHLYIKDPDRVSWLPDGGVEIHNNTSIESPSMISKVSQAVTAAGQFSLVIDYEPGVLNQGSDQDILSYQSFAGASNQENIEIEQRRDRYNVKTKRASGYRQVLTSSIVNGARQVLVVTHDGTNLKFYVDGTLEFTTSAGGAPVWYDQGGIGLGAEAYKYNEPFRGKLFRVAFYDGALSEQEIIGNYTTQTSEAGLGPPRPARWDWNERN
ncbi:LamG domain-containing protein [Mucisphaera calidilacus]|uniref:Laminin G domain protein n=1 Tax=Mucisphaera calidilacus TaxID=2527982 RepID=A0A518BWD8_9BACT|nr:LamG domain-containing protein [Mucisphaera calidilacus]QDU71244.1 Laminin G domain protein [Mucisphaera calidilacus]